MTNLTNSTDIAVTVDCLTQARASSSAQSQLKWSQLQKTLHSGPPLRRCTTMAETSPRVGQPHSLSPVSSEKAFAKMTEEGLRGSRGR